MIARALGLFILALTLACPARAAPPDCGTGGVCRVPLGTYRLLLPPDGTARGVYVFFHGYRSSAAEQMHDPRLVDTVLAHGLALAAPDGLDHTWSHPNAVAQDRDEIAFVGQILDDLETRFGFTGRQVILGGFSQGASMAWYAVCALGDRVGGAITFSGVFWAPLPSAVDCPSLPPPLVHIHGRADQTFPLQGRKVRDRWAQGNTFDSFAVLEARAACTGPVVASPAPPATGPAPTDRAAVAALPLTCETATGCARGPLTLCLHDAGHTIAAPWLDTALTLLGDQAPLPWPVPSPVP